ncbi:MAG: ACP S-malonyltransferase [Phycisphaeraceae bacterium]
MTPHDDTSTPKPAILLCPGQGAQDVGMGKAWYDASPAARTVFEQAGELMGERLTAVCFDGPADRLNRTDVAQVAIYVTSVACCRGLEEAGTLGPMDAAAGLSLGEFTALHLAGAMSFEDGLRLVQLRGRAMQDAAEAVASGMVALVGADEAQADALCEEARGDGVLVPANFNCPGQVVVSGTRDACERAMTIAERMGLRATALTVAGAFHSPVMQSAADRLAAALDDVTWHEPASVVLSNVTGRPHDRDAASIKRRLVEQLTSPVRWSESMQYALETWPDHRLIELAPGKVLSGLMRRIDRKRKVENCAEPVTAQ